MHKEVFVKIVVNQATTLKNLQHACALIARVDPSTLTILQPVTQTHSIQTPKPKQLLEWQSLLLEKLVNVRVIPQITLLRTTIKNLLGRICIKEKRL
jgi:hypothetical protein